MTRWSPAYVAVGSNLGEPRARVEEAIVRIGGVRDTRVIAKSRLYVTQPLGPRDQPDFVNAVVGLLTQLTPRELLGALQVLEHAMGRKPPPVRWGPRIIDLDLLVHGTSVIAEPGLTLPHPGIHERNFVLYPLADIAPELEIPGRGRVAVLARDVSPEGLRPLSPAGSVKDR